jgi:hypothetical protein
MDLKEIIDRLGPEKCTEIARREAQSLGVIWDDAIEIVFQVCLSDSERCPKIHGKFNTAEKTINKWIKNYKNGYENRPSKAYGKPPQTLPDRIIDEMIKARIRNLSPTQLIEIRFAHRLSMSAENILGLFLEEYLATKLKLYGWACAWGHTLKSVDFCHRTGALLQVKNRSNSENSSSSKVRNGTKIQKWHRVDANNGSYYWEELEQEIGAKMNETDFREFVLQSIIENPNVLPLDDGSPWGINI